MDFTRNWSFFTDEEEEEDLFSWRTGSSSSSERNIGSIIEGMAQAQRSPERSFMERVVAPFEAPQQFLYKLTKEVDADGFQISDIWKSVSHGASYFNPFGNTRRIEEDDIRQILFGPDSEGAERTLATSAVNLAISLLYDPLWVGAGATALAKAGKLGSQGARVAGIVNRVVDPAMVAMDVTGAASKQVARLTGNLLGRVIGDDKVARLSTTVQQHLTSRWAGVEAFEREAIGKFQMNMQEWQQRATEIYLEGRKLSPDTQRLVTRMVESEAIYQTRYLPEVPLRPKQRAEVDSILREAKAAGIDEGLLFEVYSKVQKLEGDILESLTKTHRVPLDQARDMVGRHIRRTYTVFDDPAAGLERIERLVQSADPKVQPYMRDSYMFDRSTLKKQLDSLSEGVSEAFPTVGPRYRAEAADAVRDASIAARANAKASRRGALKNYFVTEGGKRRFDSEGFLTDFGYYLNENPMATVDDAMRHVTDGMFQGDLAGQEFVPFLDTIFNYLSNGRVKTKGIETWRDIFLQGKASTSVNFKGYREHLERIAEREAIPEFIRKEVLGQPDSYLPGVIDDAVIAAREAEITELFDTLSGARRLRPEVGEALAQMSDPDEITALLKSEGLTSPQIADMLERVEGRGGTLKPRELYVRDATEWSSAVRTERHSYQLPDSPNLGTLAGRYVTPGLAAHIENFDSVANIARNRPEGMWQWLGDKTAAFTSQFKFLKIVADVGANFRDTVGSLLQMDVTGAVPFRVNNLKKAFHIANDWMNGVSNMYSDSARRIGYQLMDSGYAASELKDLAARATRTQIRKAEATWADEGISLFQRASDMWTEGEARVSRLYQFRENVLRSYVYSSKYDELAEAAARSGRDVLSPDFVEQAARQAAAITDRALFNYADVPYAVEFARRYGVAPFLTFPFKAVPQMVDALYNNPLKILKYDRVVNGWNEHWAGGSEAFAAEVQALPDHKREALVVRLPGEDVDGNPLYLDLSYFIPWFSVRDLARDVGDPLNLFADPAAEIEEARGAIAGDTGMRSNIFTPLVWQLAQAFGNNMDGLGRPIVDPTDSTEERFKKFGRYLYQFMAPPTFVGGTTADSVGKAMQAVARTSPEPVNWMNFLGTSIRTGFNQGEEDVLNRFRERPTTRALVGMSDNPIAMGANSLASLFANVTASDPRRQTRNERIELDMSNTELQREIAKIRVNKNMSLQRKREEINRLREMIRTNKAASRDTIRGMRR